MLLAKGYPDIGWNPCGGERYLDFLRFAVFVNGEADGGGGGGVGGEGGSHWPKPPSGGPHLEPQAWPEQEAGCGHELLRYGAQGRLGRDPGLMRPPDPTGATR